MSGEFSISVKKMFNELDKDGSGKVSAAELGALLKEMKSTLDQAAVERLVKKFDKNKDGELSLEELNQLLDL